MSKKLLLADDSVVIQKLVGLSFANEDIEIISTDNGDDAVSLAREVQPDVILADVVMPGLSGYEVCEAVRQDPVLSRTPVLLLTGTFEAFDEARANSVGANGQITKPFEAQALVERVTEVMNAPVSFEAEETILAPLSAQDLSAAPQSIETPNDPPPNSASITESLFDNGVQELSADLTPRISGDEFAGAQAIADLNESTASGLFGAPQDGAREEIDTLGGSMALGQTMATGPATGTANTAHTQDTNDATGVANLDATLGNRPPSIAVDARTDVSESTDFSGSSDAEETIVQFTDGTDPLGLAPTNVASDDFAFDVSEQASATTDSGPVASDPMGDSFSSLMDISESQILQGAGLDSPAHETQALAATDSTPAETIVAGYDVSTTDLVTAPGTPLGDSAPSYSAPDPLIDIPDLPEAYAAPITPDFLGSAPIADEGDPSRAAGEPLTGNDDLFDSLETGSPYEDAEPLIAVDPDDTFSSAGALEFDDDLLDADLSLSGRGNLGQPVATTHDFDAPAGSAFDAVTDDEAVADDDFSIGTNLIENDGAAGTERRVADLSPMMEQRIQETLEKVAWEAFSDLSESIVKQVMGRVEQIAWEVIPEMAETLVREEIRRMKGDDE